MRCNCCDEEIKIARKVKLRPGVAYDPDKGGADSMAYQSYTEDTTFRWAFICNACYRILDSEMGVGEISGRRSFNVAGQSRSDKATTVNEAKYAAFPRKEAEKLGM